MRLKIFERCGGRGELSKTAERFTADHIRNAKSREELAGYVQAFRNEVDKHNANVEAEQMALADERMRIAQSHADLNARMDYIRNKEKKIDRKKRALDALGEHTKTRAYEQEEALRKFKVYENLIQNNGGYDAVCKRLANKELAFPKLSPKALAIGGLATLGAGAGLYGLYNHFKPKGEYAFLND